MHEPGGHLTCPHLPRFKECGHIVPAELPSHEPLERRPWLGVARTCASPRVSGCCPPGLEVEEVPL